MRAVVFGAADHVTAQERDELLRRLGALGFEVGFTERESGPPRAADVVIVNSSVPVGKAQLDAMPDLTLLITTTSGFDHIDLEVARERGIRVERCPLARRDAVVEVSVAMGLSLLRRLPRLARHAARGEWMRRDVKNMDMPLVRDLCVGVFGNGVIGRHAAAVWRALGAEVLVCDPAFSDLDAKEEVLARARLVTLHCSLTPTSRNLIGADAASRMPRGAVLVNTARGECVDLDAVLAADRLGGLGLDVFCPEPYPNLTALSERDDVILTPHSAGYHSGLGAAIASEVEAIVREWVEERSG